jgi:hypothetical protein
MVASDLLGRTAMIRPFQLPLLFVLAACGSKGDATIAAGDATRATGNASLDAGDADTNATCKASGGPDECVNSCWTDALEMALEVCKDGAWVCPSRTPVLASKCGPEGICGYMPVICCNACGEHVATICGGPGASCGFDTGTCAIPWREASPGSCEVDAGPDAEPDAAGGDASHDSGKD